MKPEQVKAEIDACKELEGLNPRAEFLELARLATRALDAFDAKRFVGCVGTELAKPTAAESDLRAALGLPGPLGAFTNAPTPPPPEIKGADDDLMAAGRAYATALECGGTDKAEDIIRRRALLYAVAELECHPTSLHELDAASAVRHLRAKAAGRR